MTPACGSPCAAQRSTKRVGLVGRRDHRRHDPDVRRRRRRGLRDRRELVVEHGRVRPGGAQPADARAPGWARPRPSRRAAACRRRRRACGSRRVGRGTRRTPARRPPPAPRCSAAVVRPRKPNSVRNSPMPSAPGVRRGGGPGGVADVGQQRDERARRRCGRAAPAGSAGGERARRARPPRATGAGRRRRSTRRRARSRRRRCRAPRPPRRRTGCRATAPGSPCGPSARRRP